MTPEMKALWLKALRSGEYTKTDHQLIKGKPADKNMCCLAVLADINKARWMINKGWSPDISYGLKDLEISPDYINTGDLPVTYQNKYGLPNSAHNDLTDINDSTHQWDDKNGVIEYIERNL